MMNEPSRRSVAHLLWTGGWDSTYRLIQLVQDSDVAIQPVYVIDTGRSSALREIETMGRIKRMIVAKFPAASGRILPHRFYSVHDIDDDAAITGSWRRLRQAWTLGTQYDWLARLASQSGLRGLELCAQAHNADRSGLYECLADHTVMREDEDVGDYWMIEPRNGDDRSTVFSWFRFPLFGVTKTLMRERIVQQDCLSIMMQTWFCFAPVKGDPCGACNPCRTAIEEGLSERMPKAALRRYRRSRMLGSPRRIAKRVLPRAVVNQLRRVVRGAM